MKPLLHSALRALISGSLICWGCAIVEIFHYNFMVNFMPTVCMGNSFYKIAFKYKAGVFSALIFFLSVPPCAFLHLVLRGKMVHAEAFSRPLSRNEVVGLIFRLTIFGAVTYFTIKWMVDAIDPTRKQKVEAQKQVGFYS